MLEEVKSRCSYCGSDMAALDFRKMGVQSSTPSNDKGIRGLCHDFVVCLDLTCPCRHPPSRKRHLEPLLKEFESLWQVALVEVRLGP
eukprot:463376-Hanusia_phi.AAC.1